MCWYRLASRLGVPVGELKRKTTSTEFLKWMRFLELDVNSFNPLHQYLAQIAMEVRRGIVKNPNNLELKDFLLKWKVVEDPPEPEQPEEVRRQQAADKSKSAWFGVLGLEKDGKVKTRKPPPHPKNRGNVKKSPPKPPQAKGRNHGRRT